MGISFPTSENGFVELIWLKKVAKVRKRAPASIIWILEVFLLQYRIIWPIVWRRVPHCSGEIKGRGWVGGPTSTSIPQNCVLSQIPTCSYKIDQNQQHLLNNRNLTLNIKVSRGRTDKDIERERKGTGGSLTQKALLALRYWKVTHTMPMERLLRQKRHLRPCGPLNDLTGFFQDLPTLHWDIWWGWWRPDQQKDNYKDNPRDLWPVRHWFQFWQPEFMIIFVPIKSDIGQHLQFLRCLWNIISVDILGDGKLN